MLEEQIVSAKRGAENVEGAASERENVHRQLMSADARCALLEEAVAEGRKNVVGMPLTILRKAGRK